MAYTDGAYTVNGQTVYLTFNQQHDGTFGAITSGLDSVRSTGVQTQDVAGIPEDSVSATDPAGNSQGSITAPSTGSNPGSAQSNTDQPSSYPGWSGTRQDALDYPASVNCEFNPKPYSCPEEQAAEFQRGIQVQYDRWGDGGYVSKGGFRN